LKTNFYTVTLRDIRVSFKDLSGILLILSFTMLLPTLATFTYVNAASLTIRLHQILAFLIPATVLYILYVFLRALRVEDTVKTKHIMMTIALTWTIIALVGAIPFIWRHTLSPLDAVFESMSGWSTTGYSMISDLETVDRDLLIYRSLSQGMGGLGVISIGMMVLMHGGNMGAGYYDMGVWKIKPGIRQAMREALKIYGMYIIAGIALLYIAGMSFFDALNLGMTAVSTGGFSTHASIGYYNSIPIELVLMTLMILGMTSFIVHFRLFRGELGGSRSDELKYFFAIMLFSILVISAFMWGRSIPGVDTHSIPDIVRKISFQVVSGMSTGGFNIVDVSQWPDFAKTWMIGLMYVGGMSSSTAGGIHVIRFIILLKATHYGLKRLILPKKAVLFLKVDGKPIADDIINVVGYSGIYMLICVALACGLMVLGYSGIDSISTIMGAMGNDGMRVISTHAWYGMHEAGKVIVIIGMWVGRIEIYPGLLILRNILDRLR